MQIHSVEARHTSYVRNLRATYYNDESIRPWITNASTPSIGSSVAGNYSGEDATVQLDINIVGIDGGMHFAFVVKSYNSTAEHATVQIGFGGIENKRFIILDPLYNAWTDHTFMKNDNELVGLFIPVKRDLYYIYVNCIFKDALGQSKY